MEMPGQVCMEINMDNNIPEWARRIGQTMPSSAKLNR